MGAILSVIIPLVVDAFAEWLKNKSPFQPPHAAALQPSFPRPEWLARDVFNFAVAGAQNAGKSSFINVVRGLTPSDNGAATVSSLENHLDPSGKPKLPSPYEHPDVPNVRMFDCAGLNTPSVPLEEGIRFFGLVHMHFVAVLVGMTSDTATFNLMKALQRFKVPFFVIINAMDQRTDHQSDEQAALVAAKAEVRRNIQLAGIEDVDSIRMFGTSFKSEMVGDRLCYPYAGRFQTSDMLRAFKQELD